MIGKKRMGGKRRRGEGRRGVSEGVSEWESEVIGSGVEIVFLSHKYCLYFKIDNII